MRVRAGHARQDDVATEAHEDAIGAGVHELVDDDVAGQALADGAGVEAHAGGQRHRACRLVHDHGAHAGGATQGIRVDGIDGGAGEDRREVRVIPERPHGGQHRRVAQAIGHAPRSLHRRDELQQVARDRDGARPGACIEAAQLAVGPEARPAGLEELHTLDGKPEQGRHERGIREDRDLAVGPHRAEVPLVATHQLLFVCACGRGWAAGAAGGAACGAGLACGAACGCCAGA